MANAQKMIEERKKALNALRNDTDRKGGLQPPSVSVQRTEEKAKKIAQLQVNKYMYLAIVYSIILYL